MRRIEMIGREKKMSYLSDDERCDIMALKLKCGKENGSDGQ